MGPHLAAYCVLESKVMKSTEKNTRKKDVSTAWDHEPTQSDVNQEIEGVGRAGATIQPSDTPGVSLRSAEQIRELGTSRITINGPGNIVLKRRQK